MAILTSYSRQDISGGGTISIPLSANVNYVDLYGSLSMSGNCSIQADGTPALGNMFILGIENGIDKGAYTLSILGVAFDIDVAGSSTILGFYNGSAWKVTYLPSLNATQVINNKTLVNATITLAKMADLNAAQFIMGNSGNRPTATTLTGAISVSNTGVVTIVDAAVATANIANSAVTTAKINNGAVTLAKLEASLQNYFANGVVVPFSYTIPSASVLTANTTPVNFLGAGGANTILQPVGDLFLSMTYGGTAYAANGDISIYQAGSNIPMFTCAANAFLFGTESRRVVATPKRPVGVTDTQYLTNAGWYFTVDSGDPTTGNSPITISGLYRVVNV